MIEKHIFTKSTTLKISVKGDTIFKIRQRVPEIIKVKIGGIAISGGGSDLPVGGATGAVLTKTSPADFAMAWIMPLVPVDWTNTTLNLYTTGNGEFDGDLTVGGYLDVGRQAMIGDYLTVGSYATVGGYLTAEGTLTSTAGTLVLDQGSILYSGGEFIFSHPIQGVAVFPDTTGKYPDYYLSPTNLGGVIWQLLNHASGVSTQHWDTQSQDQYEAFTGEETIRFISTDNGVQFDLSNVLGGVLVDITGAGVGSLPDPLHRDQFIADGGLSNDITFSAANGGISFPLESNKLTFVSGELGYDTANSMMGGSLLYSGSFEVEENLGIGSGNTIGGSGVGFLYMRGNGVTQSLGYDGTKFIFSDLLVAPELSISGTGEFGNHLTLQQSLLYMDASQSAFIYYSPADTFVFSHPIEGVAYFPDQTGKIDEEWFLSTDGTDPLWHQLKYIYGLSVYNPAFSVEEESIVFGESSRLAFYSSDDSVTFSLAGGGTSLTRIDIKNNSILTSTFENIDITDSLNDALDMKAGGIMLRSPSDHSATGRISFQHDFDLPGTASWIHYDATVTTGSRLMTGQDFGIGRELSVNTYRNQIAGTITLYEGSPSSNYGEIRFANNGFSLFPTHSLDLNSITAGSTDEVLTTDSGGNVVWAIAPGAPGGDISPGNIHINPTFDEGDQVPSWVRFGNDNKGTYPHIYFDAEIAGSFILNRNVSLPSLSISGNIITVGNVTSTHTIGAADRLKAVNGVNLNPDSGNLQTYGYLYSSGYILTNHKEDSAWIRCKYQSPHRWETNQPWFFESTVEIDSALTVNGSIENTVGNITASEKSAKIIASNGPVEAQFAVGDEGSFAGKIFAHDGVYSNMQGQRTDSGFYFYTEGDLNAGWIKKGQVSTDLFKFSHGIDLPSAFGVTGDGNAGQVLGTDTAGGLYWVDNASGGGGSPVDTFVIQSVLDTALKFENAAGDDSGGISFSYDGLIVFDDLGLNPATIDASQTAYIDFISGNREWRFPEGLQVGDSTSSEPTMAEIWLKGTQDHKIESHSSGYLQFTGSVKMLGSLAVDGITTMNSKLVMVGSSIETDKSLWIYPAGQEGSGTAENYDEIKFGLPNLSADTPSLRWYPNPDAGDWGHFVFNRDLITGAALGGGSINITDPLVPSSSASLTFEDGVGIDISDDTVITGDLDVTGVLTFGSMVASFDSIATDAINEKTAAHGIEFDNGSTRIKDGALYLNYDNSANAVLYAYEGSPTGASISYDSGNNQWNFSHAFNAGGNYMSMSGWDLHINVDGVAQIPRILFGHSGDPYADSLQYVLASTRFEFSDDVHIIGDLSLTGSLPSHGHVAADVSDFDTEVENNTDVAANTTHRGLTNEHINWTTETVLGLSAGIVTSENDITAKANLKGESMYLNPGGTSPGITNFYFRGAGSDSDGLIYFLHGTAEFTVSKPWNVTGALGATSVKTDTINEKTASAGVTVDGLLIKDGGFPGSGLGGLTDYDVTIGDVVTPDYGIMRIGNSVWGRTSNTAGYNMNGATVIQNIGGPVTGDIEFAIIDSAGFIRFATPKSGVGNATYNPRSMLIAGPAIQDSDIVTVDYWKSQGIFDNLLCDTSGAGADLGVQNNLEVEGQIFIDNIDESTTGAGVTIDGMLIKDSVIGWSAVNKQGSDLADLESAFHGDLSNAGTNSHATIDTHLADDAKHSIDEAIEISLEGTVDERQPYVVPFDMTITGWTMFLDVSGSMAIGVWKDSYANYPPTVADVIVTPSVTTAVKNQATGLSISLTKGDILMFNVNSVTTSGVGTLALTGVRA